MEINDLEISDELDQYINDFSDFLEEEDEKYDEDYSDLNSFIDSYDELPDVLEMEEEDNENEARPLEDDDEETSVLRYEAAQIALGLMNYVEYNVVSLENELTILGDAFNQLLDKTRQLDDRIALLSDKVNKARFEGAKQAMEFIHDEIKLISDNLEGAIKSTDPSDREVLEENVDILNENKAIIDKQILGLREIGADTQKLENDAKVLESSIMKLKSSINSNAIFSLSGIISNEINQVMSQIADARKAEDQQDIDMLQDNFELLVDNKIDIEEKLWELHTKNIDIDLLREQFDVLNINLDQFSRTIDDTVYHLSIAGTKKKK